MTKTIYIIAGEPSGDFLGANLMRALKEKDPHIMIEGIGGPKMIEQGLKSLFPMEEISLVGLFEIVPHILNIKRRIDETIFDISFLQPDAVITIDSPGFCKRILKKIKNKNIKKFHYVAPSVWAWRPKRAEKLAKIIDHLFCLFPFEPPYFTKHHLDATFVGHPLTEHLPMDINKDENSILLLPGSRKSEVKKLLPIFLKVAKKIKEQNSKALFTLPTLLYLDDMVKQIVKESGLDVDIQTTNHAALFQKASFAIAASGTVSLELAKYKVPHVIAYKINALTAFALRFLIKIPFVSLPNIISKTKIVPECLQESCNVDNIYEAFMTLKKADADRLHDVFITLECPCEDQDPSQLCADLILKKIGSDNY